eukprot:761826-Hanusia_phi.AAC.1
MIAVRMFDGVRIASRSSKASMLHTTISTLPVRAMLEATDQCNAPSPAKRAYEACWTQCPQGEEKRARTIW